MFFRQRIASNKRSTASVLIFLLIACPFLLYSCKLYFNTLKYDRQEDFPSSSNPSPLFFPRIPYGTSHFFHCFLKTISLYCFHMYLYWEGDYFHEQILQYGQPVFCHYGKSCWLISIKSCLLSLVLVNISLLTISTRSVFGKFLLLLLFLLF